MPARRKVRTVDDESCSDLDSFIEEDGDEHGGDSEWAGDDSGPGGGDGVQGWREALKETLGGYDASKFAEVDRLPDRRMHASFAEIAAEEAKAARIAREVDRVEAERDAAEREERRRRREEEGYGGSESGSESESDSESESEGDSNGRPRKRRRRCAFVAR